MKPFSELLTDLRFVIGTFLSIIGLLVLVTFFSGAAELVVGVHVNLLGGALLLLTGVGLGSSAMWKGNA